MVHERKGVWSAVRWTEFLVLGLAIAGAVTQVILGEHWLPLSPEVLAALALVSKAIRAALAVARSVPSSTVDPVSWLVAVMLAAVTAVLPTPATPVANRMEVRDVPETTDATHDAGPGASDPGPGDGGPDVGPLDARDLVTSATGSSVDLGRTQ